MRILLPLFITRAVETAIYMFLKPKDLKLFIVVSVMNLFLNMGMNIGLSFIDKQDLYWIVLSSSEVATILIESVIVFLFIKEKYPKVLLFSCIANAASFLIGFLLSLTPIYQTKIAAILVCLLFVVIYLVIYFLVLSMAALRYRNRNNDSGRDEQDKENY